MIKRLNIVYNKVKSNTYDFDVNGKSAERVQLSLFGLNISVLTFPELPVINGASL